MNSVILLGRSTKEPDLRYIPSTGNAVATFSIAVERTYAGKDGNKETDFFNIVVWGKPGEFVANNLGKGKMVAVKGSIQNRSYETKEGEKKYITEIISERVQILEWGNPQNRNLQENKNVKPDDSSAIDSLDINPDLNSIRMIDEDDVPF